MSSNYSANQFEGAFKPQRMQLWLVSKAVSKRPAARTGHTTFIADDRGHLLPGAEKKDSAWPDFKGTWALPNRIPAHHVNPTSRSADGLKQLRSSGLRLTGTCPSQTDLRCSAEEQEDGQSEDVPESQTDPLVGLDILKLLKASDAHSSAGLLNSTASAQSSEDGASSRAEPQDPPLRAESSSPSLSSCSSQDRRTRD